MAVGFPPQPVYPQAIDSDRTLYLVYNSSEARIAQDNSAWAEEVEIYPVGANDLEIWPENGFASINGELFYYDAVEKDANEKIYKFKRCARNIGGNQTQFNAAATEPLPGDPEGRRGTWVRGFIVAEHHNQIVDAIEAAELFVLDVDERIQRLVAEPTCVDDVFCASIEFDFEVSDEGDSCEGTTAVYSVTITGLYNSFKIDFGDGISTNIDLSGTHIYPPNSTIDPIITVTGDICTVIQTPSERTPQVEPEVSEEDAPFAIPIPEIPDFPEIAIPDVDVPVPTLELPQIVFPCLEIPDIHIPDIEIEVPSIITIVPSVILIESDLPSIIILAPTLPNIITLEPTMPSIIIVEDAIPSEISIVGFIPSTIEIIGCDIISTIEIIGGDSITSIIEVIGGDSITSVIEVIGGDSITSTIEIIGGDSIASIITVEWDNVPTISVVFEDIPTISCDCTITVEVSCISGTGFAMQADESIKDDFKDGFKPPVKTNLNANAKSLGIPSEIKIVTPTLPNIKVEHDLPQTIALEVPEMPTVFMEWRGPPLRDIKINAEELPKQIDLVVRDLPEAIKLDTTDMPEVIYLLTPKDFPTQIKIDGSEIPDFIEVRGIPNSIEVKMPSQIIARLEVPENAEIPLVYKGGPVPVQFDTSNLIGGEDGEQPCFALVPCNPNK